MKKNNELRAGVVLSYFNLAIGTIIPLIYTPIMLQLLGQSEYGLYSLSSSVIGYLSLLSFGLGSTIVRYIAKFRAENDKKGEEKVVGLFLILYAILACFVLVGGYLVYSNVDSLFSQGLTNHEMNKMKLLILIMTFNTAISFPISVFSSITIAHEKYVFQKMVDILSTIGIPILNIFALYMGFGSVGMAIVSTMLQFIILPINMIYCFKKLDVKPVLKDIPFYLIKEIISFSFFVFLSSIVDMLFWSTDKVLLGAMLSTVAVAVYNIGGTFNSMLTSISTSISSVLVPRLTVFAFSDENQNKFNEYLIKIGRLQYLIVSLAISGFITFGHDFIILWVGESYSDAYYIALVTMIPLCIPLVQTVAKSITIALNKHQFRSVVYLIIAIFNVISTYLIIPYLGGLGAAICSGTSYIIGQGIIMNIYYKKVIKLDIVLFWKNIISMSKVPIFMCVIFFFILKYFVISNFFEFLVWIVIYTFVYCLLSYFFSMNEYEKNLIKVFLKK